MPDLRDRMLNAYEVLMVEFHKAGQVKLTLPINIIDIWNGIEAGLGVFTGLATVKFAWTKAAS